MLNRLQRFQLSFVWMLVCVLTACTEGEHKVPHEIIEAPSLPYHTLMWLADGELLAFFTTEDHNNEAELQTVTLSYFDFQSNLVREIQLQTDTLCRITRYYNPTRLQDGRLGLRKHCLGRYPDEPLGSWKQDEHYLMVYDWDIQKLEYLVVTPTARELGPGRFTWNPDMTRGIQAGGSLYSTLYWLTPEGIEPMDVTLSNGDKKWSLADTLIIARTPTLSITDYDLGVAHGPAWSPDGRTIAFFASPEAIGKRGQSRVTGQYHLYLMDPITLEPTPALDNLYFPGNPYWSPDNRWIVLQAYVGESGSKGLWLFSVDSGDLYLIAKGEFNGFLWSQDGQEIIAVHCLNQDVPSCQDTEIVKYDVRQFVLGTE